MKFKTRLLMVLTCCGFSAVALADILELKNGAILNSTCMALDLRVAGALPLIK